MMRRHPLLHDVRPLFRHGHGHVDQRRHPAVHRYAIQLSRASLERGLCSACVLRAVPVSACSPSVHEYSWSGRLLRFACAAAKSHCSSKLSYPSLAVWRVFAGPVLSKIITDNLYEQASIWCFFSIGQVRQLTLRDNLHLRGPRVLTRCRVLGGFWLTGHHCRHHAAPAAQDRQARPLDLQGESPTSLVLLIAA